MTEIVVNKQHGGFGLSEAAILRYAELKGMTLYPEKDDRFGLMTYWTVAPDNRPKLVAEKDWYTASLEARKASNLAHSESTLYARDIRRDDPALVQVVRELGEKANGRYATLEIVDVPDDVSWAIEEYDGLEWVAETHRTW